MRPATPTVEAIGAIHLEGNTVPHTWFGHIRFGESGSGKPDLLAIMILADIVYWYRPVVRKDEDTDHIIAIERKFKGDKYSRSYSGFAEKFGSSKLQAKRAVDRLRAQGLITTEFRVVRTGGNVLPNVLFIEPVPAAIATISTPSLLESRGDHYSEVTPSLLSSKDTPHTGVRTYTENTTEISTESKNVGAAVAAGAQAPAATTASAPSPSKKINTRLPLTYYFGHPPAPSYVKSIQLLLAQYRSDYRLAIAQEDLNAAAIEARRWWDEDQGLPPKGIEALHHALSEVLAPCLAAIAESDETGRPFEVPPKGPDGKYDLLGPLASYLGRVPTPGEVSAVRVAARDLSHRSRFHLNQYGYWNAARIGKAQAGARVVQRYVDILAGFIREREEQAA